jgi:hypothetical protein
MSIFKKITAADDRSWQIHPAAELVLLASSHCTVPPVTALPQSYAPAHRSALPQSHAPAHRTALLQSHAPIHRTALPQSHAPAHRTALPQSHAPAHRTALPQSHAQSHIPSQTGTAHTIMRSAFYTLRFPVSFGYSLSVHPSIHPFVSRLSFYPSVRLSACPSVFLQDFIQICLIQSYNCKFSSNHLMMKIYFAGE